ncbi:CpaF/VirB11 family protein [Brochothrix campestris]|uniref:Bacterial type II secretion system protein E domain-containing protein n=1 Tax=Brochothrix campestris FSL F6-1037 TaxID=1265861 RepID=W7C416_9LIST|nr:CpaF/VirB11 family protein [Brochothrix campestris]EUJ34184.1 hypothetical protein BCAMP_12523 [Brochothrix campestris FSL F6-1037]
MKVRNIEPKETKEVATPNKRIERHKPISDNLLEEIQKDIMSKHASLVIQASGRNGEAKRVQLKAIIMKEHRGTIKNSADIAEYIVAEMVGTGVIESIMEDETVTDISWNGTFLTIESNDGQRTMSLSDLGLATMKDADDYMSKIINKFANTMGRPFDDANPSLDGLQGNIRINAMHNKVSPSGKTMSMRIVRPKLALKLENFSSFAPDYIYRFLESIIKTHANVVISGETGTGKTELQKLLLSFVNNEDKIIMIEDVPETHAKKLFPEKDVFEWLSTPQRPIGLLVKDALRNQPKFIIVSETRGAEAFEMLQAVLSGHYIVTTLHSVSADASPRRFVNMCKSGYDIDENATREDILSNFDFGIHIKKLRVNGKTIRFLSEIVEYSPTGNTTIFSQKYRNGQFIHDTQAVSTAFQERMAEKNIVYDLPLLQTGEEEIAHEDEKC